MFCVPVTYEVLFISHTPPWHGNIKCSENYIKGIQAVRIEFLFILKVANIRCFILIVVEIFHNIIRK